MDRMDRMVRDGHTAEDAQVDEWLVERARKRRSSGGLVGVPVITVSREYGARGAAVGRIVAERLGFKVWDREVLGEHRDARAMAAVAHELEARGSAVLIGRGLGFLVSPARALRVRVVCPLAARIAGLVEREGISPETARAMIDYADRSRREFVRTVYDRDVDDVTGYDLWVGTGELSLDGAAAVIIAAYRYRFGAEIMRAIGHARP